MKAHICGADLNQNEDFCDISTIIRECLFSFIQFLLSDFLTDQT